jgi:hypothetical protein
VPESNSIPTYLDIVAGYKIFPCDDVTDQKLKKSYYVMFLNTALLFLQAFYNTPKGTAQMKRETTLEVVTKLADNEN